MRDFMVGLFPEDFARPSWIKKCYVAAQIEERDDLEEIVSRITYFLQDKKAEMSKNVWYVTTTPGMLHSELIVKFEINILE